METDRPLRSLTKAELISLIEELSAFGRVEAAVRAALDGIPEGGVGAARAALAIHMARLIDVPPEKTKATELAAASKELRQILVELDLEGESESEFFDDLDTRATAAKVGNRANRPAH